MIFMMQIQRKESKKIVTSAWSWFYCELNLLGPTNKFYIFAIILKYIYNCHFALAQFLVTHFNLLKSLPKQFKYTKYILFVYIFQYPAQAKTCKSLPARFKKNCQTLNFINWVAFAIGPGCLNKHIFYLLVA